LSNINCSEKLPYEILITIMSAFCITESISPGVYGNIIIAEAGGMERGDERLRFGHTCG
jgi:hypothetical protein